MEMPTGDRLTPVASAWMRRGEMLSATGSTWTPAGGARARQRRGGRGHAPGRRVRLAQRAPRGPCCQARTGRTKPEEAGLHGDRGGAHSGENLGVGCDLRRVLEPRELAEGNVGRQVGRDLEQRLPPPRLARSGAAGCAACRHAASACSQAPLQAQPRTAFARAEKFCTKLYARSNSRGGLFWNCRYQLVNCSCAVVAAKDSAASGDSCAPVRQRAPGHASAAHRWHARQRTGPCVASTTSCCALIKCDSSVTTSASVSGSSTSADLGMPSMGAGAGAATIALALTARPHSASRSALLRILKHSFSALPPAGPAVRPACAVQIAGSSLSSCPAAAPCRVPSQCGQVSQRPAPG
jgi:hypothetical protein